MLLVTFSLVLCAHVYNAPIERMGTLGSLTAWVERDEDGARALAEVLRVFDEITAYMTPYAESDVTRLNRSLKAQVAQPTYEVLTEARRFSEISNGLFDITFAALNGVWKFDSLRLPDEKKLLGLLGRVSWRRVHLDRDRVVRLDPGTEISLNGIAKGYAVDRAVAAVRAMGVSDFILRLGGDLYASGRRGDRAWKIGVRDPRGDDSFAEMDVTDAAFSTSGDYERFGVLNGVRYHHILDPRTGYPATASRAVSVLAPSCIAAEGLTKILFIAGKDEGWLKQYKAEAVVVSASNQVWTSPGMKLTILHPPKD